MPVGILAKLLFKTNARLDKLRVAEFPKKVRSWLYPTDVPAVPHPEQAEML